MELLRGRSKYALFGLVVVIWGLNYLFVKEGLTLSAPLWLASLRAGIGFLALAGLLAFRATRESLDRRGVRDALLIGVPATGLFFGLWFVAAVSVEPGVAAVVIYTFPLWVALLSAPVLGQPLRGGEWAAIAGGFGGVVLLTQPWEGASGVPIPALLALLGGAVSWAVGTVLFQRRFRPREYTAATIYQMLGGTLALLFLALVFEPGELPSFTPALMGIVLWLGILGTAVAYLIWYDWLARTRASTLSAYVFLVPIVALVASAVVYGERLAPVQWAGVVAVLVCLYLLGSRRAPLRTPPSTPVSAGPGFANGAPISQRRG